MQRARPFVMIFEFPSMGESLATSAQTREKASKFVRIGSISGVAPGSGGVESGQALLEPGAFWPGNWTPILVLAFGSQVFGQGLVVYAVGHLRPIVVGLALLIQPAISATVGALRFGEVPGVWELTGAGLVVAALLAGAAAGPRSPLKPSRLKPGGLREPASRSPA